VSFVPTAIPAGSAGPLDRAQVVRAALELLDEIGLDELTMRRLAERSASRPPRSTGTCGTRTSCSLLADEISGGSRPWRQGRWRAHLAEMARNYRRGLLSPGRRAAAREHRADRARRLRHIETTLRALRTAGLSGRDAARAAYHFNIFVTEFAADEGRYAAAASATGSRRKMFEAVRKHFRELPADEYPVIVELADHLAEDDADGLFEFGLEAWLRAIESAR
jgi:hypothetical protein